MGLGLSKGFIIALLISIIFSYGMKSWMWMAWIMGIFIVCKIVWQFLTK